MAFDRLIKRIDELHNPSVAGLDPRLEYVPQFIQDASFVKLDIHWRQLLMQFSSSTRR